MKRTLLIVAIICLVASTCICFVSCGEKSSDDIIVSVYVNNGHEVSKTPIKTFSKENGEHISMSELFDMPLMDTVTLGYYLDKDCKIKYDESAPIVSSMTLYVYQRPFIPGNGFDSDYCLITYVYNGNQYRIIRSFDCRLSAEDFVASAYGKPLDSSKLHFYLDENCENELILKDQLISFAQWYSCPGLLTIYVQLQD